MNDETLRLIDLKTDQTIQRLEEIKTRIEKEELFLKPFFLGIIISFLSSIVANFIQTALYEGFAKMSLVYFVVHAGGSIALVIVSAYTYEKYQLAIKIIKLTEKELIENKKIKDQVGQLKQKN